MKNLFFILLPIFTIAQVGIGTESPQAMLEVKGDVIIRNVPEVQSVDYLLGWNEAEQKVIKIRPNNTSHKCPQLKNRNQYNLHFESNHPIPNPNSSITINNIIFTTTQIGIQNNKYLYRYTNSSGQFVDLINFVADFSGLICTY